MNPTIDDIEALRRDSLTRLLLADGRTWLDLARAEAVKAGAELGEVVTECHRPSPTRARHATWLALREQGLSYSKIGRGWGCHHTTVMDGVKVASAPRHAGVVL